MTSSPGWAATNSRSSCMDDGGTATDDVAGRIQDALRDPFCIDEVRLKVTVSMGAAQRSAGTADPAELMRQADFAMYMAKHGGKGRYQLFDARGYDEMTYRAALRADLATAVQAGQLRLDYQPVVEPGHRRDRRSGGPGPLGTPDPGPAGTGRLHPPGRGNRRDRPHRLLGAGHRKPSRRRLAPLPWHRRRPLGLGQSLHASVVQRPEPGCPRAHPGPPRFAGRQGDPRGHRIGPGHERRRRGRRPSTG